MEEIWKNVEGYNGRYQISNQGRVKSVARYSCQNHYLSEKILSIDHDGSGYPNVMLYIDGKRKHEKIHRLVAKAFVENPRNLKEVDHIDTNKDNNVYTNLRWVTHSENHLNPLTVARKRQYMTGFKFSAEKIKKQCVPIGVYKDDVLQHVFDSYTALDTQSKDVFGVRLWNVYARRVVNGEMDSYHGYTFKVLKNIDTSQSIRNTVETI